MRTLLMNMAVVLGLTAFGTLQASAITVNFTQTKAWSSGYNAEVVITNDTNSDINGWSLSFGLGDSINKTSRSSLVGNDPYTVKSLDYSAKIPAGKTETFSYTASGTFDAKQLTSCLFNGKACGFLVAGKAINGTPISSLEASSQKSEVSSKAASSKSEAPSSTAASSKPVVSSKAASSKPVVVTQTSIPGRIQAQHYQAASPEDYVRSGDTTGPCAVGDVDMTATSDNGGGCIVGWTKAGEWLEYTITNNAEATYDITLRLAANAEGKTVSVSLNDVPLGSVQAPNDGWAVFQGRTLEKVKIPAGMSTLKVSFDTGATNFNYVDVTARAADVAKPLFNHPGIFSTKAQLDFVKNKIQRSEQPWIGEFEKLKASNPLAHKQNPRAIVPGSADPKERKDMDEMIQDGSYLYAAALLWYFTDEQKYADYTVKGLNGWSVFEKIGMPLYLTWAVPHFVNAAEIIKHSPGSNWQKADVQKFSSMVDKYFWKIAKPPKDAYDSIYGANHYATSNESQFAIAIFLDDKAKFDEAVSFWKLHLPKYIFQGRGPKHFDGEAWETCRDLNHMKLGTTGVMYAAESAWNQGVDLWKGEAERFKLFGELHAGMMMGDTAVPAKMCAWKKDQAGLVFCKGAVPWSSPTGRPPCNEASWDLLIGHVSTRLGKKMPMTVKMATRNTIGGISKRAEKWETLLKAGVPE